jgi:DNA-binding transcriptional ArsR family regulator
MASDKEGPSARKHPHRRPPQVVRYINQFLDAACDESRRAILELLVPPMGQDSPDGYELRVGEIAQQLGLANSTTSEHLHQLLNAHLVSARKEGTMVYYRLCNHHLVQGFHELLQALETHYHTFGSPAEASGAREI